MRIGIVACGAIVRELCAIGQRQGWDFTLTAVPAQLHNRPEMITPAVAKRLDSWVQAFDLILVGYGDCGTRGQLDALLAQYSNVLRIPGPHCYEFLGGKQFEEQAQARPGTFYLTDFLARHFEGLVYRGLGLDRYPELQALYFAHYSDLLYLQQADESDETERAAHAASRLGLEFSKQYTGTNELEGRLVAMIDRWRQSRSGAAA